MTSYLPSSIRRILPTLPTLTLATVFTSVAYNYAVQSRLTKESERLHSLRLTALDELREFYQSHLTTERQPRDEQQRRRKEAEEDDLVRDLIRLGLDPARIGTSDDALAAGPPALPQDSSASRSDTTTDYSKRSTTAWSDVLWGGPNSPTAAASPASSSSDIMERATASARKTIANLSLFGGRADGEAAAGGEVATANAQVSEEELALHEWLAEVEAREAEATSSNMPAGEQTSPAPSSNIVPPRTEQILPSRDPSLSKRRPEYLSRGYSNISDTEHSQETPRPYRRTTLI